MSTEVRALLSRAAVIPVLVVDDVAHAVPLAEALVAGGLPVLEVTLRTAAGLPAIAAMRRAVPDAIVGVGTLLTAEHCRQARDAGAQFGVAPALSGDLVRGASGWPFLPGVMTPGEVMHARTLGFDCCKLFPAQQAGGAGMLRALHSVFPDVSFCPTGGIGPDNAAAYLSLPNVLCVGGSWPAPPELVRARDWDAIRRLAATASGLRLVPHDRTRRP